MAGEQRAAVIIHRLIAHHLKHGDDWAFYRLQAEDAADWIEGSGVRLNGQTSVLDLGCGHGIFGGVLLERGCRVTFADETNSLFPQFAGEPFVTFDIEGDRLSTLGKYDLVLCSNVLEHLPRPERFLRDVPCVVTPGGYFYLSWTNWLSPWGGHEFSPFHYLGPHFGLWAYDRLVGRKRKHTPGENLFPTSIGSIARLLRQNRELSVCRAAPRYYTELSWLMKIPLLREFLVWNCAILLRSGRRG